MALKDNYQKNDFIIKKSGKFKTLRSGIVKHILKIGKHRLKTIDTVLNPTIINGRRRYSAETVFLYRKFTTPILTMIKYIEGDLVKDADNYDVIAHCCNCFCTMGAGIAPQIKHKFPEAYAADCTTTSGDQSKLGTITYTENTTPIVVNLYGQYDYKGRQHGRMDLDYSALRLALRAMKEKFSGKTFGLPMIGAGLAGGDWDIIEAIIQEELNGEDVTVVKYVP
jgi:O-acetyl-ADP-ribose deacetylase (regulator of RNase III)